MRSGMNHGNGKNQEASSIKGGLISTNSQINYLFQQCSAPNSGSDRPIDDLFYILCPISQRISHGVYLHPTGSSHRSSFHDGYV